MSLVSLFLLFLERLRPKSLESFSQCISVNADRVVPSRSNDLIDLSQQVLPERHLNCFHHLSICNIRTTIITMSLAILIHIIIGD